MRTFTSMQFEQLTGPQLVKIYNDYAKFLGEKPVKKFQTKAIGQKRTWDLMAKAIGKHDDDQRKPEVVKPAKKVAAKKPKAKTEKRVTISSMCRDMILDGATNEEIFKALQENWGEERFGPDKRHYPAWYRGELRRKGALPPAFDPTNRDPNAVHTFED